MDALRFIDFFGVLMLFLALYMLYFETVSTFYHNSPPQHISSPFAKLRSIHPYKTGVSTSDNFYLQYSRLNQKRNSVTCFCVKAWLPQVRKLPKNEFKRKVPECF